VHSQSGLIRRVVVDERGPERGPIRGGQLYQWLNKYMKNIFQVPTESIHEHCLKVVYDKLLFFLSLLPTGYNLSMLIVIL
jgi:hypothetical protein